jgi:hypothetical protein
MCRNLARIDLEDQNGRTMMVECWRRSNVWEDFISIFVQCAEKLGFACIFSALKHTLHIGNDSAYHCFCKW